MNGKKSGLFFFFFSIFLVLTGGCAHTPREISLTKEDSGKIIHGEVGDRIVLKLPANPTTGYLWKMSVIPDSNVVRETETAFETPKDKNICGAPGTKVYIFTIVGPGETGLRMEYKRPWEQGVPPAEIVELMIRAAGKSPFILDEPDRPERRVGSKGQVEYGPMPNRRR